MDVNYTQLKSIPISQWGVLSIILPFTNTKCVCDGLFVHVHNLSPFNPIKRTQVHTQGNHKGFSWLYGLKTWLIYAQTGMGTKDTWNHTQTQSLHTHTKEVKAVSVDGSITSTRDDKRQFSSHHHMTLCMEDGWRSMDGERGRRVCVLGLKLAVIPPPRFCKDIQSTCKRTCVHITNICAQSGQHADIFYPSLFLFP